MGSKSKLFIPTNSGLRTLRCRLGTSPFLAVLSGMTSILIVEDETLVLALTESILRQAGYKTLTAADTSEAIAILRSEPDIDVLLTDIGLKKSVDGGLSLARRAVR